MNTENKNEDVQKSYTVKYLGVTYGKMGILSRKVPLTAEQRHSSTLKRYEAPLPPKDSFKKKRNSLEPVPQKVEKPKVPEKQALKTAKVKTASKPPREKKNTKIMFNRQSKKVPVKTAEENESKEKSPASPIQHRVSLPKDESGSPKIIDFNYDALDLNDMANNRK